MKNHSYILGGIIAIIVSVATVAGAFVFKDYQEHAYLEQKKRTEERILGLVKQKIDPYKEITGSPDGILRYHGLMSYLGGGKESDYRFVKYDPNIGTPAIVYETKGVRTINGVLLKYHGCTVQNNQLYVFPAGKIDTN